MEQTFICLSEVNNAKKRRIGFIEDPLKQELQEETYSAVNS
jgi:hypothetical protein